MAARRMADWTAPAAAWKPLLLPFRVGSSTTDTIILAKGVLHNPFLDVIIGVYGEVA